jgi:hypothetical protein
MHTSQELNICALYVKGTSKKHTSVLKQTSISDNILFFCTVTCYLNNADVWPKRWLHANIGAVEERPVDAEADKPICTHTRHIYT